MDALHLVGAGEAQQVVAPRQVGGMVGEAVSAEVPLRQIQSLDLRGHGAVEEEDALGQKPAWITGSAGGGG